MDHVFSSDLPWSLSEYHTDVFHEDFYIPDCQDSWMEFQPQYVTGSAYSQEKSTPLQRLCAQRPNDKNDNSIAKTNLGASHVETSSQAKHGGNLTQYWPQNSERSTRKRRGESITDDDTSRDRRRFLKRQKDFEEEQLRERYELLANSTSAGNVTDMSDDQKLQASRDTGLNISQIELWLHLRQTTSDTTTHKDVEGSIFGSTENTLPQTRCPRGFMPDNSLRQSSPDTASGDTSGNAAVASSCHTVLSSPNMSCVMIDDNSGSFSPCTFFNPDTDQFARRLHSVYGGVKVLCWLDTLSVTEADIDQNIPCESPLQDNLESSPRIIDHPEAGVCKDQVTQLSPEQMSELVRKITSDVIKMLNSELEKPLAPITPLVPITAEPSEFKDSLRVRIIGTGLLVTVR